MPGYSQITLGTLTQQILTLMDDSGGAFWVSAEVSLAIQEALRVFGGATGYWRQRGTFQVRPTDISPYYDMSVLLPAIRPRTVTLGQICTEIEYHLLENPSGIAGTGFSGQVSIDTILQAIQRARNRFVVDTHLPNSVHLNFAPVTPTNGLVTFPQSSVFVHRVTWQDAGGQWSNLWRQDEWAFDHSQPNDWSTNAAPLPQSYSEASLAPLQLQMYEQPQDAGTLEAVTVDSLLIDTTDASATFDIPDEWIHAVKYAALEEILTGGNQIVDQLRAQYCGSRYKQAVDLAKDARSVIRLTLNGNPLMIDSLAAIDAGNPYWRNQQQQPYQAGILYDFAVIGLPDQTYGIGVDLVASAPVPVNIGDSIDIGEENLQDVIDYCVNYLNLKCGGNEFKSTIGLLDNFQRAIATRKGANAAKIMYFEPLFGQWQREEAVRPDVVGVK